MSGFPAPRPDPRPRRHSRRRRGQAMVEFAMVLPIMVMVFMAIIEFGFLLRSYLAVNYMASQAIKEASLLRGDNQGELNILKALLRNSQGLDPSRIRLIDPQGMARGPFFLEGDTLVDQFANPITGTAGHQFLFFDEAGTPADTSDDTAVAGSVTTADYVKLTVEYTHRNLAPYPTFLDLDNVTIRQTKTARLE